MKHDLTRWNRAGLKTIRYVDGNAATYLEDLRQELLARFPAWSALDADIPANESTVQRNARGLADRGFAAVGIHAAGVVVAAIVELEDGRDAEVLVAEDEVGGEAVVAIPDAGEVLAFLHAEEL